jgi:hypothetical protein
VIRVLFALGGPLALWGVSVSTAFEGGSAGKIDKLGDCHFRVGLKGETDENGRNRQATWYYFRVDGAPQGECMFDIVDLPGEYNFKPNRGAITDKTPPVISVDGRAWTHVTSVEYDAAEPRLRLRVMAKGGRFWIAHTPPYTNEVLERLRRDVRDSVEEQVIGRTPQGRDLLLWTVNDASPASAKKKKVVWLMARQHSWESGTSWVAEGAVRALIAQPELRNGLMWKILPMGDPDGVARGGVRFNAAGFDLNRNWDTIDPKHTPEIVAQHAAIARWLRTGGTVDLFLTLHNTETAEYLEGPPSGFGLLGQRFFERLTAASMFDPSRPLSIAAQSTAEGMKGRMTVVQGLNREFGIPSFLMEQRIAFSKKLNRLPTVEDRLRFGAELVRVLASILR